MNCFGTKTDKNSNEGFVSTVTTPFARSDENRPGVIDAHSEKWLRSVKDDPELDSGAGFTEHIVMRKVASIHWNLEILVPISCDLSPRILSGRRGRDLRIVSLAHSIAP